jgi:hypothetical protein
MNLAHAALGCNNSTTVDNLSNLLILRISKLPPNHIEISGNKPSNALFWFTLAGCTNKRLLEVLTICSNNEIIRMSKSSKFRELDRSRINEKVAICTLDDTNGLSYYNPRCLIHLFRFGSRGRDMKKFMRNVDVHSIEGGDDGLKVRTHNI